MGCTTLKSREWRHRTNGTGYLITTSTDHFDLDWLNAAYGTEDMFWAKPLPKDQLAVMLANSLTLGLYEILSDMPEARSEDSPSSPRTPSPTLKDNPDGSLKQIGMARLITDHTTFAYLCDVYIAPTHRSLGLAKWLIGCVREILQDIPAMTRSLLLTSSDVAKRFYGRDLGFWDIAEEGGHPICMTRKAYEIGKK